MKKLYVLWYSQPFVGANGKLMQGDTWYARKRPGDGGVDWEYTKVPEEAGIFSEHWKQRFLKLHGHRAASFRDVTPNGS